MDSFSDIPFPWHMRLMASSLLRRLTFDRAETSLPITAEWAATLEVSSFNGGEVVLCRTRPIVHPPVKHLVFLPGYYENLCDDVKNFRRFPPALSLGA